MAGEALPPLGEPLVRAADVRAADEAAVAAGVPVRTLMRNAGTAVARSLQAHAPAGARIVVVCGPGNNGGDGYVAALRLARAGRDVQVVTLAPERRGSEAAEAAKRAWLDAATSKTLPLGSAREVADTLQRACGEPSGARSAAVLLDALFGTGLNRALDGAAAEVAAWAARARADGRLSTIVAIDLPSGVDADRAVAPGPVVRADLTAQLGAARLASALAPVRFAFGRRETVDIGLPAGAWPDPGAAGRPVRVTAPGAAASLPPRPPDLHKGSAGAVAILGGGTRYAGAPELAARGAHRFGAGLVTVASPVPFPNRWPESIWRTLAVNGSGDGGPLEALAADPPRADAWAIGPGLEPQLLPGLAALLAAAGEPFQGRPLVIDASALTHDVLDALRSRGGGFVTPHLGEAARLLARSVAEVTADPLAAARSLAHLAGEGAVLKGAGTCVASVDGRVAVIDRGDPGLASGGTGDVLAGVVAAALAARGAPNDRFARVAAACWLHAVAGERAARRYGAGTRASDVANALPRARRVLEQGREGAW